MVGYIRSGNIKLILCFAFYLAWWVVGFNPRRPIRGLTSAWLLIPAAVLGVLAVLDISQGLVFSGGLMPGMVIAVAGVVGYVVLLWITSGLLHRPVTTELFIIVLWATFALLEINTLVATGSVSPGLGCALMALCLLGTAVSIVCYQLFYELEVGAAFIDGAIPLLLAGVMTGIIAVLAR